MVRHVIYYLFLCVCMCLSCTQKCPKGLTRDLFFPPWLQWQHIWALAPFSCVRSRRALRILSHDILELWLSLYVHTGKILLLTHVSYLGHSSVLFSAPTFRERSMQEPVSFHLPLYPALLWWLVLVRLILAFGIITCPVVSN